MQMCREWEMLFKFSLCIRSWEDFQSNLLLFIISFVILFE